MKWDNFLPDVPGEFHTRVETTLSTLEKQQKNITFKKERDLVMKERRTLGAGSLYVTLGALVTVIIVAAVFLVPFMTNGGEIILPPENGDPAHNSNRPNEPTIEIHQMYGDVYTMLVSFKITLPKDFEFLSDYDYKFNADFTFETGLYTTCQGSMKDIKNGLFYSEWLVISSGEQILGKDFSFIISGLDVNMRDGKWTEALSWDFDYTFKANFELADTVGKVIAQETTLIIDGEETPVILESIRASTHAFSLRFVGPSGLFIPCGVENEIYIKHKDGKDFLRYVTVDNYPDGTQEIKFTGRQYEINLQDLFAKKIEAIVVNGHEILIDPTPAPYNFTVLQNDFDDLVVEIFGVSEGFEGTPMTFTDYGEGMNITFRFNEPILTGHNDGVFVRPYFSLAPFDDKREHPWTCNGSWDIPLPEFEDADWGTYSRFYFRLNCCFNEFCLSKDPSYPETILGSEFTIAFIECIGDKIVENGRRFIATFTVNDYR